MGKTLAEKIFEKHVIDEPFPGVYALKLDLVPCHEITTPIGINDLKKRNLDQVFDPSKIVAMIDHVSPAKDEKSALQGKIIREWARKHGIKFYDIGNDGVCHALIPEQGYVFPGMTIVCGDSHTCTYGAFGAFAAGIGTTDLEIAILKGIAFFKKPKTIKIELKGKLQKGVYAKDVILFVISQIGVKGATDCCLEFVGEIIENMEMDERMTICNMAVEAGATCGFCSSDWRTRFYYAEQEIKVPEDLDFNFWQSDEDAVYEKVFSFDLSNLEPLVTYGYTPAEVKSVKEMLGTKVDQIYIGSCTNGRLSDLEVAAEILEGKKIASNTRLIVVPATTKIYLEAVKKGLAEIFVEAGACFSAPTCGACLGMSNGVLAEGEVCASTTNRNFAHRMGKGGMVHLMSPATAAATALKGEITDPREVLK